MGQGRVSDPCELVEIFLGPKDVTGYKENERLLLISLLESSSDSDSMATAFPLPLLTGEY